MGIPVGRLAFFFAGPPDQARAEIEESAARDDETHHGKSPGQFAEIVKGKA